MKLIRTISFLHIRLSLVVVGLLVLAVSCGGSSDSATHSQNTKDNTMNENNTQNVGEDLTKPIIVFLGDSLTEGYQVAKEDNYPSRVEKLLSDTGISFRAVNGGLSGDTSSGGLDRLEWFLNLNPECLFVALGANDGLRGLALEETYNNLAKIIETAQARGVDVLLAGQMIPPNYGEQYTKQFKSIYPRLAREYNVPLMPFLLEGVAGENELNLDDGIHPNPDGYAIISKNVAEFISENFKPENIN